jgi:predicted NBD/HSP70 family sugar kinase
VSPDEPVLQDEVVTWELHGTSVDKVVREIAGVAGHLGADLDAHGSMELAIAVAGHIDEAGRSVTITSAAHETDGSWTNVPLAALVEELTGRPTRLVNDANAAAVHDLVSGPARDCDDFISVLVNDFGVGCGIVANGRLVLGARGSAGELGHIRVPDAPRHLCHCGGVGCVERVASTSAIAAQVADLNDCDPGADWSVDIYARAARLLGSALITAVNLLNPDVVVLHGPDFLVTTEWDGTESVFLSEVKDVVCSRAAFSDAGLRCTVVGQIFKPESLALGAAHIVRGY